MGSKTNGMQRIVCNVLKAWSAKLDRCSSLRYVLSINYNYPHSIRMSVCYIGSDDVANASMSNIWRENIRGTQDSYMRIRIILSSLIPHAYVYEQNRTKLEWNQLICFRVKLIHQKRMHDRWFIQIPTGARHRKVEPICIKFQVIIMAVVRRNRRPWISPGYESSTYINAHVCLCVKG